jgi:hypothetical protein
MAQQGNTYTGKLADMPTYLTSNHMYLAYDTLELYGFQNDNTPIKLAPSDQISESDVRNIINNYLSAGKGITITFNPDTEKLEISGQNITTDDDLYIDENEVIRNNITENSEVYLWRTGDSQLFTTTYDILNVDEITVNGQVLIPEQFQLSVTPKNEFEILDPLDDLDYIQIKHKYYIITP